MSTVVRLLLPVLVPVVLAVVPGLAAAPSYAAPAPPTPALTVNKLVDAVNHEQGRQAAGVATPTVRRTMFAYHNNGYYFPRISGQACAYTSGRMRCRGTLRRSGAVRGSVVYVVDGTTSANSRVTAVTIRLS